MRRLFLSSTLVVGALLLSSASFAQSGAVGGAVGGAVVGGAVGGPAGAAVGATVGATTGAISDAERPRFRSYVTERHHPSYRYQSEVRVGAELPEAGVTYYDVPREYGMTEYRYTVVNDRPVLVNPRTRRIVQVID